MMSSRFLYPSFQCESLKFGASQKFGRSAFNDPTLAIGGNRHLGREIQCQNTGMAAAIKHKLKLGPRTGIFFTPITLDEPLDSSVSTAEGTMSRFWADDLVGLV